MTIDFGTDIDWGNDLNPSGGMVSGIMCLAQCLMHRLDTPNGGLIGDPLFGYDVASELDDDVTPADIARIGSQIDTEFLKDPRVISSSTACNFTAGVLITTSYITCPGNTKFALVLSISDIISIVKVQNART